MELFPTNWWPRLYKENGVLFLELRNRIFVIAGTTLIIIGIVGLIW